MDSTTRSAFENFYIDNKFDTKGKLCVALVVTQHFKKADIITPESLITSQGGQVLGLGKQAVQTILSRHGITKVLASEGGRTSRGSIGAMRDYVDFLNKFKQDENISIDDIEKFWIEKVKIYFSAKPFKLSLDKSQSLRSVVKDLLAQAETKQKQAQGMAYVGAMLQHLVGAKLDCALGVGKLKHNSFSTSDSQKGRAGDFQISDVVIHVTTSPSEAVILKCQENLNKGLRPVLVTNKRGLDLAELLSENIKIDNRIDIFEIEQFVALNIYELSQFAETKRAIAVKEIIDRYNEIVSAFETDPSLKIEII